jgi:hypothetical protein
VIVIKVDVPVIAGKIRMNKFRPQQRSAKYKIKEFIKTGRVNNYNWQTRVKWYPAGWGFNKKVLGGIFGRLHYLACHAPMPVQERYQRAYRALDARLTPHNASLRYIVTYSAGAWL